MSEGRSQSQRCRALAPRHDSSHHAVSTTSLFPNLISEACISPDKLFLTLRWISRRRPLPHMLELSYLLPLETGQIFEWQTYLDRHAQTQVISRATDPSVLVTSASFAGKIRHATPPMHHARNASRFPRYRCTTHRNTSRFARYSRHCTPKFNVDFLPNAENNCGKQKTAHRNASGSEKQGSTAVVPR